MPLSGPWFSQWLRSGTDEEREDGESYNRSYLAWATILDMRAFPLWMKSISICLYLPCEACGTVGTLLSIDLFKRETEPLNSVLNCIFHLQCQLLNLHSSIFSLYVYVCSDEFIRFHHYNISYYIKL